jgi:hypothetical protein
MFKSGAELARLKGVSRQAINTFITKNAIPAVGKKGKLKTYDTEAEPLAGYLSAKAPPVKQEPPSPPPENTAHSVPPNAEAANTRIYKPLNAILTGKIPEGQKPSSVFYAEAVSLAKKNQDAALLFKLGQIADKEDRDELYQQQMLKTEKAKEEIAQEKAARHKIENDIRREQFMDKAAVKLLWGKVFAVHTSIIIPQGLKIADMLNALPPGPDRRNKMQEMIDNENFAALESIKRILADFIKE